MDYEGLYFQYGAGNSRKPVAIFDEEVPVSNVKAAKLPSYSPRAHFGVQEVPGRTRLSALSASRIARRRKSDLEFTETGTPASKAEIAEAQAQVRQTCLDDLLERYEAFNGGVPKVRIFSNEDSTRHAV